MKHLGDHIKKRRLDLGLTQREAARQIGVKKASVQRWESRKCEPTVSCFPLVLAFLGYDPRPKPSTLCEELARYRETLGLSQPAMAKRIGISSRTLWLWETGQAEPSGIRLATIHLVVRHRAGT